MGSLCSLRCSGLDPGQPHAMNNTGLKGSTRTYADLSLAELATGFSDASGQYDKALDQIKFWEAKRDEMRLVYEQYRAELKKRIASL